MSVAALTESEQDLNRLLALLREETLRATGPARCVGAFMLDHYTSCRELPPVQAIARATNLPHTAAQRAREAVCQAWRRLLSKLGLHA